MTPRMYEGNNPSQMNVQMIALPKSIHFFQWIVRVCKSFI